jgi:hypothetical protein
LSNLILIEAKYRRRASRCHQAGKGQMMLGKIFVLTRFEERMLA